MTTENVVILFTDIVGSTELSQRLSADASDEVRRSHFSILRQAVAEAGGTEVKSLGDGLMVVFSSPSAALAAAVTMQQGVEQDNRGREHSVGLRVGLSTGEVGREDHDYFGDPVVEAARLCAACESGQILAADVVRLVAGRRSSHKCRSLGELALKGLPEPVETVEVVWEPISGADTGPSIPLPSRLAARPAVGVVGRDAEIHALTDVTKRVIAGEGRQLVLISGEAGMGKTSLVAEAARSAFDSGACVLFGHCEEDLATPYQLFAEALDHYITHAPEDTLHAHVAANGSELSRLSPAFARRIPDLPPSKATDADTERFLLFAAAVGLLTTVSQDQPVVLVLDDLQWADKGSLLLLRYLAAADQSMRVLVLVTYRDNELSRTHPLFETLATLLRQGGVSRTELTGLDDSGVLAIMEAVAGYALDHAGVGLAHALYRETDGNPFFVGEVLRHLSETGAIYQDAEGRWTTEATLEQMALPESVRVVVGARVGRLGRDSELVLSMAAVIGRDFDLDVLARATNTSEDELLDILEAAAAAALVREPTDTSGRYSFSHALIQHTLYEDLGPNRRARAHRVVAQAIEDLCGDRPGERVGELARHWTKATQPIDLDKAIGYSQQAGDAALSALAPADAMRYYTQALELSAQADAVDPRLDIDLAIGLGTAQRQAGDAAFRETLLAASRDAAALDDTDRLVAAALANDRGFFSAVGAIDAAKVEVLETALDRLSSPTPERALVLASLCKELAFGSTLEHRQALADEAIAIARSLHDDAILLRVLNLVRVPLIAPPLLEPSLTRTAEALVLAERIGDPAQLFWAWGFRGTVAANAGMIEEFDRCLERQHVMADRLNQPIFTWVHTWIRSLRIQFEGDPDEVEQMATQIYQLGIESSQPDAAVFYTAAILHVQALRGTMLEILPMIEQMGTATPDFSPALIDGIRAFALVEGGRTEDARLILERFAAIDFTLPLDAVWFVGMVAYVEAAIECRDPRYAGPLLDRLAPWVDQWCTDGGATTQGPIALFLGGLATVLGRFEDADSYFARSAAMCEHMGARFYAARTNLLWGRMLAERRAPGDIDKARALLTEAHAAAATSGYGNVEARAAEALRLLEV